MLILDVCERWHVVSTQALSMSNSNVVTLEVVLTVQLLIRQFGAEQDSLTWDLILDITSSLVTSAQVLCQP